MATQTQTQPQVVPDVVPGTTTFVGRPVERPIVRTLRRFAKHRMAVVGVIVIAILVILAIVGNEAEALKQQVEDRGVDWVDELQARNVTVEPNDLGIDSVEAVELHQHYVANARPLNQLDLAAIGPQVKDAHAECVAA